MKEVVYLMGPPCSGKSTLLEQWKDIGGQIVPEFTTPVPDYVHNAWLGDEDMKLKAQQWAFEQNVHKDDLIKKLSTEGTILVERCCLDVLSYSRALKGKAAIWTENSISRRKWTPGKVILLSASIEVLRERWLSVRHIASQEWVNQWLPLSESLWSFYSKLQHDFGIPIISTETDLNTTIQQLTETIHWGPSFTLEGMVYLPNNKERR